ncbi:hypothetical protein GCM10010348_16440 [Streptomyces anthocyanicus]|uniref:DUF2087 domain-containing protein n=1 Tax=Streptomyces anthocyanicus TaxID=68174 RepID=UPI001875822F|nr:DUF2087 domain-containing protein [Streptomyces anthocyanicus]GHB97579.1 hypothetical protein GCM10010348_16440 [Streptomyces anthocyanicus]
MASALAALPALFAEESRVRAFAAVALGAGDAAQVAGAAGLSAKEAAGALRRLREQGVVTSGDDGGLVVAHGRFRELARVGRTESAAPRDAAAAGDGGPGDMIVRTFVRNGRLVRLPARWTRKKVVLRHIAEQTFAPGVEYPERTVDEKLRAWCEDGEVDHVTLRRHLVDFGHLRRSDGVYARPADSARTGTA